MLGDVRDIVLIVAGIIWALIFLVFLVVTLAIAYLARKYLGVAHDFLRLQVPAAISEVQLYADVVKFKTAELPGSGSRLPLGQRMPHVEFPRLPFFRRRRPWWERILPH